MKFDDVKLHRHEFRAALIGAWSKETRLKVRDERIATAPSYKVIAKLL